MPARATLSAVAVAVVTIGLTMTGCSGSRDGTISGVVESRNLARGAGVTFKNIWRYAPIQVQVEALEHGHVVAVATTSEKGTFRAEVGPGHYVLRIVSRSEIYPLCVSKPASVTVRKQLTVLIKGLCYPRVYPG
ncbi:MAG TPA: hypothetical protein VMA95_14030 [Streptosporangiaceae bacterium]|nr:hypothetical protein [Streptosporangiaceae bacterium]